jgi:hypothetical protein
MRDHNHTVPVIPLSEADRLWLDAVHSLFVAGKEVQFERQVHGLLYERGLHDRLPRDFDPKKIDQRLLKFGTSITLLGAWHIDPQPELLTNSDILIRTVKQILLTKTEQKIVTADELATTTGIPTDEVERLLFLLTSLGQFSSGSRLKGVGVMAITQIQIDYDEVVREYARYSSMEELLREYCDRWKPAVETYEESVMGSMTSNRVERGLDRLKNQPVVAAVVLVAIVMTGILTFTGKLSEVPDQIRKFRGVHTPSGPLTVSGVSVYGQNGDNSAPANTLDNIGIHWSHDGPDRDLRVSLVSTLDNTRVSHAGVRVSDGVARFTAASLKTLWPGPQLGESIPVRVELQDEGKVYPFGPFNVRTGLLIMYYLVNDTLVVTSSVDGTHLVPHDFEARAVAWRMGAKSGKDVESCRVRAKNGTGKAPFPAGFVPDPSTLQCVYLGDYPTELVRYEYLGAE